MSDADNRHPQQPHPDQGWQPLPQGGEYEQEATAFVQLPEGFTTGAYGGGLPSGYGTPHADPLAAPGHGYTPPASFTPQLSTPPLPGAATDPSSTGQWTMPFTDPQTGYADPSAGYPPQPDPSAHSTTHQDPAGYPGAPEAAQPWGGDQVSWPVAGSAEAAGAGGAWSVPTADEGPEESGEYLVGDDGLTVHPGHPTHPGNVPHPGYEDYPAAQDYRGDPANSLYGGATDTGRADHTGQAGHTGHTEQTGHWNFTAGLSATTGRAAPEAAPAAAHEAAYADPVVDPYAAHTDGSGLSGGAAGATGHWSLPADAMAQWPPAAETAEPAEAVRSPERQAEQEHPAEPAGRAEAMDPGPAHPVDATDPAHRVDHPDHPDHTADHARPADRWSVPAAEGEQPDESGQFAASGAAEPATETAGTQPTAEPARPVADAGEPGTPHAAAAVEAPAAEAEIRPRDAVDDAPAQDAHNAPDAHDEHPAASYVLRVNGTDRPVTDAWIGESLLYVLRERLGLAGAKDGCSQGECGACSVQVDGRLVASCLVPAATTAGSEVRTVEGLAQHGTPSDVQRALAASGAVQCGFCVPGMAMTVHDLLEGNHAPSELETRKALCGNLCRCSGYRGVLDAVDEVVKARAQASDAAYTPAGTPEDEAGAGTARIPHQAGPADPMDHPAPDDRNFPGHQGPDAGAQPGEDSA